uniref:Uncharacterized protein n=1 Tax=Romanomermis culicivorax TaxID=13658 RepID=A0A915IDJ3_ROMCU
MFALPRYFFLPLFGILFARQGNDGEVIRYLRNSTEINEYIKEMVENEKLTSSTFVIYDLKCYFTRQLYSFSYWDAGMHGWLTCPGINKEIKYDCVEGMHVEASFCRPMHRLALYLLHTGRMSQKEFDEVYKESLFHMHCTI